MTEQLVHYVQRGGIGRLTLDRPPLNVMDFRLFEALQAALRQAADDRRLRVLGVAGVGRAFSAGADVADHTMDRVERMLTLFHGAIRQLEALEVPVVAMVHGATLGGGAELALACDFIMARDDLRLGFPEIRLAAFPPLAAARLPALIGRQLALDLVLTGRSLDAAEALGMRLVARVFPADEFESSCAAVLADLAALSNPALRLAKRAVREAGELPAAAGLDHAEALYLRELTRLPDAREGVAAFLAKRAPVWAATD